MVPMLSMCIVLSSMLGIAWLDMLGLVWFMEGKARVVVRQGLVYGKAR